jgi:hypothetical protein
MKITSFALGLMATTAAAAVPTEAAAGVNVAVGISVGTPVLASQAGHGGRDASRFGFDRGYREGAENGYADGRKGRRFEIWHDGDYRDADDGFKGWMGSRREYERSFRRGFETGYRRAFAEGARDRRDRRERYDQDWRYDGRYDGRDRW